MYTYVFILIYLHIRIYVYTYGGTNIFAYTQYIARFTDDSAPEFVVAKTGGDTGERQVCVCIFVYLYVRIYIYRRSPGVRVYICISICTHIYISVYMFVI